MTAIRFRKIKAAWALTENTAIAILLAFGFTQESLVMLLLKIGSSYLLNMLDLFINERNTR